MERLSLAWRGLGVWAVRDPVEGAGEGGEEMNTQESTTAVLKCTQVGENLSVVLPET